MNNVRSFLSARSGSSLETLADLLIRAVVGLALGFGHGIGKLPPSEQFVGFVTSLGFPAPELFAWAASLAEFLGGLFLALGLLTRPSAFFAAFTMGVAVFGAHGADPFQKKELALLYGTVALAYALMGPGKLSADAILFGTRKR